MPLAAWISEQSWLSCLSAAQFAKSGIPRALREASAPEAPCWSPLWPLKRESGDPSPPVLGCAGESAVGLGGLGPARRAQAAAPLFPAAGGAASAAASSAAADPDTSPRRRSVAEYHRAFASGEATPSSVAAAALEALRSVGGVCSDPSCSSPSSSTSSPSRQQQQQPAARWFIALDEGDVMRQAEASTAR